MSSHQQFKQQRTQLSQTRATAPSSILRTNGSSAAATPALTNGSTSKQLVQATAAARSSALAAASYLARNPNAVTPVRTNGLIRAVPQLTRPPSYQSPTAATAVHRQAGQVLSPSRAAINAASTNVAATSVRVTPAASSSSSSSLRRSVPGPRTTATNALSRPSSLTTAATHAQDEDSLPDFPYPASYTESKARMAAEERTRQLKERERIAKLTREHRLRRDDSAASLVGDVQGQGLTSTSSSSTAASSIPIAASATSAASPNARRRLSGASSSGSTASQPSNSYSSGIALLERRYEQQQQQQASTAAPATTASSSSSSSATPAQQQRATATSFTRPSATNFAASSSSSSFTPHSSSFNGFSSSTVLPASVANLSFLTPTLGVQPAASTSSSSSGPAPEWSCSACTYDNPARVRRCDMCGTARGAGPGSVGPMAHLTSPGSFQTASFVSPAPFGPDSTGSATSSVRAATQSIRSSLQSDLASRSRNHMDRAENVIAQAAQARAEARRRMLEGGLGGSSSSTASMTNLGPRQPQTYSYADRGAQLAQQARRSHLADMEASGDELDGESDDVDTQSPFRAHERETAGQAIRRLRRTGAPSSSDDHEEFQDLPNLHPRTREHMNTLSSVHARVEDLQRQIQSELDRSRAGVHHRHQPSRDLAGEERKYPEAEVFLRHGLQPQQPQDSDDQASSNSDGDDEEDDPDDGDNEDSWPSPSPALALTQSRPSATATSSAAAASATPVRAGGRVTATFAPYVSPADQARQEAEAARRNAAASNSQPSAGARVGVLSVRLDRAEALRQEMTFLSSLFDNVRSYQTSLVQSLHQAGFVDDSAMARLPGLHVGLIHYLIESAWAAAARSGGFDGAGVFDGIRNGPSLPEGHEERVKTLEYSTLTTAATDDCCICLEAMGVGAIVSNLAECKHIFHSKCIKEWLGKANSCPLCKRTAIPDPNPQPASKASGSASSSVTIEIE